ncbi:UNVERIFIED_CONTAM: hypothetical protein NCL1_59816 [Trichonephila clavipes]
MRPIQQINQSLYLKNGDGVHLRCPDPLLVLAVLRASFMAPPLGGLMLKLITPNDSNSLEKFPPLTFPRFLSLSPCGTSLCKQMTEECENVEKRMPKKSFLLFKTKMESIF